MTISASPMTTLTYVLTLFFPLWSLISSATISLGMRPAGRLLAARNAVLRPKPTPAPAAKWGGALYSGRPERPPLARVTAPLRGDAGEDGKTSAARTPVDLNPRPLHPILHCDVD